MAASYDSKWIATASEDGTIIVWDAERGTIVQEWLAHGGYDGKNLRLVSAGGEGSDALAIWDIDPVALCAWSSDGALIASASMEGMVVVWDALTFQQRNMVDDRHPLPLTFTTQHLRFSQDSRYLAWISHSNLDGWGCRVWQPRRGNEPRWLPSGPSDSMAWNVEPISAFSFDSEGRRIATAHADGSLFTRGQCAVRIWDPATGAMLAVLAGHSQSVTDVSFSPDGRSILSASEDGSAKIWDVESGLETASLLVHERYSTSPAQVVKACFSPDGKRIATIARSSSTVQLWRTDNAECTVEFIEHAGADVLQVMFSPDGEFLVSGDINGVVVIRRLPESLRY
ncbi:hypothetical protein GSI_07760 [Ganoderma sinense ZZ0214-1]|uniref:Uncharacterized protein n=1 Tax=Ganoderma sinense ZZ0214-1 TaxID=1077348 RepID=A0A2G8S8N7_9APHY|nr:hypothetical protein GSI_07674 [Ganoderma sinense ZZ0214-1]PIL30182.1 hypothetical protein GSI_07760 [Ganoderma sinense ZZ0214-1]